jgi:hypothetical protein
VRQRGCPSAANRIVRSIDAGVKGIQQRFNKIQRKRHHLDILYELGNNYLKSTITN